MRRRVPLVYLYGTAPGRYLPIWPAFIVGDHPDQLYFDVEVDASPFATSTGISESDVGYEDAAELRREYVTTIARRRIHQQAFRERVLNAYRTQCALCRLRHIELLDAAHITPDSDETGEPLVSNGLALCKLHHAAYDKFFLSVTPDYLVQVRTEILAENDGPMLQHGLKELHGIQIVLPSSAKSRPDRDRLAARHRLFLEN
jgi:putative restriction endonuclease